MNAIGVDIGGTALKGVRVDARGQVLANVTSGTSSERMALVSTVLAAVDELGGAARDLPFGLATPGLAHPDGHCTQYCPGGRLDIEGLNWREALDWPAAVPVLNDAQAALLGECWTGAGRGRRHVVLLTLGTGVGGAVLADGRLLTGARQRAGHLGHLSVSERDVRGIVGTPGTLEDAVGEHSVGRRTGGRATSTTALVDAAGRGEPWAAEAWDATVRTLSRAVASIINAFDPEVVIIGGGIARAGDALFVPLRHALTRDEWRPGGVGVPVVPAELGAFAGAIGAARRALAAAMGEDAIAHT